MKISNCARSIGETFIESKDVLRLTESQQIVADKMLSIVSRWGFVFNTSQLGAGKSYMCLEVANRIANNIIIICPATVTATWEKMKRYLSKPFEIVTYDKFRGNEKHNNSDFIMMKNGSLTSKKYLETLIDEGVTFIFDECHKLKNNSLQKNVVSFVLGHSRKKSNKTRVIFSSGTLMDNPDSALNFFDMLGIRKSQITEKCMLFDPKSARKQESEFDFFKGVILKNMAVACSTQKSEVNVFNKFFNLHESVSDFKSLIDKLETYISKKFDAKTRANFIHDCMTIELLKVGIFIEEAKKAIIEGYKVVLIFNFKKSLHKCVEFLKDFDPLIFEGDTPIKKRIEYIKLFQDDTSGRSLIIGNMQVLSEGIDLDDKTGIHKRKVFASPNYSAIKTYQLTNRFSRMDTRTKADVCWVYAEQGKHEKNIIEALEEKHETMFTINKINKIDF